MTSDRMRPLLRTFAFAAATLAAPAIAQSAPASPAAPAASVPVPREVLERYVGRYELNGTIVTVGVSDDGRLTSRLAGQPEGPPLRAVSATEFVADAAGVRLVFEGEGPLATRIRSLFNGRVAIGTRIVDGALMPGFAPVPASLDAAARTHAVTQLASALRQRYVFADIGEQAASRIEAGLAAGEYDNMSDPSAFAARLSVDVNAIARDKHLQVVTANAPPPPPPGGATAPPRAEAGIVRADRLASGIGYIEVVGFPPPDMFRQVLDRAMAALDGSTALIVDVRRNGGGAPPSVAYLVSFLLDPAKAVHINDIVSRIPGTDEYIVQSSYSEPTPVSFAGRPVYVLTSSGTFSGGEEFAYDIQALGRGVLVGELTGGGANPTGPAELGSGLRASIPGGRAQNPITGTNWEGRGVEPDIAVPAADALKVALERLGHAPVAEIDAASRERVFAARSLPRPGSEAAVRSLVAGVIAGTPEQVAMTPEFATTLLPRLQQLLVGLGELRSVAFRAVDMVGGDVYDLDFANGTLMLAVVLAPDGKLAAGAVGLARAGGG